MYKIGSVYIYIYIYIYILTINIVDLNLLKKN